MEAFCTFVSTDRPFAAVSRLRQSIWRDDAGLTVGTHRGRPLGSYLTEEDGRRGANFLSPALAALARRELLYLDRGTRVDRSRLSRNLLTSQALCFNLFGTLKLVPEAAHAFVRHVAPDLADQAIDIRFEHAPGAYTQGSTGDRTAFDAFIECRKGDRLTFLGVEVKYTEHMRDDTTTPRVQLEPLAVASGLFADPAASALRRPPIQQLWREHLLALSLIGPDRRYADGRFICIAPRLNADCWNAFEAYGTHLIADDPAQTHFQALTVEHCLDALHDAGAEEAAASLRSRYVCLERLLEVVTALEL